MSSADPILHRSYLYAPGTDVPMMRKALAAGADAVIFDLEDTVPPGEREGARRAVVELLEETAEQHALDTAADPRCEIHVRVGRNADGEYSETDLEAAIRTGVDGVRLPKVEAAREVRRVAAAINELELQRGMRANSVGIYPTVESARGALAIADILTSSPRIVRAALGTADLLADLGAYGDDDLATLHVRSHLVLVSRATGVGPPIDGVHTDLDDLTGLEAAARRSRALGFFGKSVIHPRQLPIVNRMFTPTDEELNSATATIAALERSQQKGSGALALDGQFVDAAVAARARALLALGRRQ